MANKHRKPGDWQKIATERGRRPRYNRTTRGLTNTPTVTEVGSAAYRRLQRRLGNVPSHG